MPLKKGSIYKYETGKYVREELGSPKGCKGYRMVDVPDKSGRKVIVCITNKKGEREGRTKAVALLRSINTKKGQSLAKRAKVKKLK